MTIRPLIAAALLFAAPAPAQDTAQPPAWNSPTPPFRLIGNVWYVGTAGLSAFLIVDPAGLILIDGALPESAPLIAANIRAAGFDIRRVRRLLVNHAHYDHAGGLAALKRASGAQLVASRGDAPDLAAGRTIGRADLSRFPPVKVDRVIDDGATVRVGRTILTAHLTPGHTSGCTSWSLRAVEGARPLDILFACSLSVAGQPLVAPAGETAAARDFRRTFAKLRTMKADVFVNFHAEGFALATKRARLAAGDPLAFVDPAELPRQVAASEAAFTKEIARQRVMLRH